MKLLEIENYTMPVGEGTCLSNVKIIFSEVLRRKIFELDLNEKEFATFKLGLADCLPYEAHKSMKEEFWCCGVHIKVPN